MSSSERRYPVTAAVLFGSLLLFGPLTVVVVRTATNVLWTVLSGGAAMPGVADLLVILGALVVASVTVVEVARVRLHGFAELHRGTPGRRLARHTVLATACLAGFVVVGAIAYEGISFGIARENTVILGLSAAVGVALVWMLVRAIGAFYRGTQSRT